MEAGAAKMIEDNEIPLKLKELLAALVNDPVQRESMEKASQRFGRPHAGQVVAERILELIRQ